MRGVGFCAGCQRARVDGWMLWGRPNMAAIIAGFVGMSIGGGISWGIREVRKEGSSSRSTADVCLVVCEGQEWM